MPTMMTLTASSGASSLYKNIFLSLSSSSFIIGCLQSVMGLFLVNAAVLLLLVMLERSRAQKECFEVTSCLECLSLSQCEAWTDATGGRCLEGCGSNAQVDCYSSRFFPDLDDDEICQLADTAVADAQLCSNRTSCGDCTGTSISDGTSCLWFREESECRSICDDDTECLDQMTCPIVNCKNFETCTECLQTPECRGWAPSAVGCLESCDMIADVRCYTADESVGETCQIADEAEANAALCSAKSNCAECVGSILSDGNTTCQWFLDGEYCASGCGLAGCGETICDIDDAATGGNECDGLECQACLDASTCGWAPLIGCLSSCNDIADAACFSSGDSNAIEVCGNETMPTSSVVGMGSVSSIWLVVTLLGIQIYRLLFT